MILAYLSNRDRKNVVLEVVYLYKAQGVSEFRDQAIGGASEFNDPEAVWRESFFCVGSDVAITGIFRASEFNEKIRYCSAWP